MIHGVDKTVVLVRITAGLETRTVDRDNRVKDGTITVIADLEETITIRTVLKVEDRVRIKEETDLRGDDENPPHL